MLADQVDHVIGIDTHRGSHAVAVCNTAGGVNRRDGHWRGRLRVSAVAAVCGGGGAGAAGEGDRGCDPLRLLDTTLVLVNFFRRPGRSLGRSPAAER